MSMIDVLAILFFHLFVNPINTYCSAEYFISFFTILASPSLMIQPFLILTLPWPFSNKSLRRTHNLRIRLLYILTRSCCRRRRLRRRRRPDRCTPSRLKEGFSGLSFPSDQVLPAFEPPSKPLHYFDCFSILFHDTIQHLSSPYPFSNCYDYYDPETGDFYNRYFDSSLFDEFYDLPDLPANPRPVPKTTLYSTNDVTKFLASFSVLQHYHSLNSIPSFSNQRQLFPGDPTYQRILLNAQGLQARLQFYGETIALKDPIIYLSATDNELPIVIDTGASCSITPNPLDFDEDLVLPDFTSLTGISSKTSVNGQGTVTWKIEDQQDVLRPLSTKA